MKEGEKMDKGGGVPRPHTGYAYNHKNNLSVQ